MPSRQHLTSELHAFYTWLDANCQEGCIGRTLEGTQSSTRFLPLRLLQDYLTSTRVVHILREEFPPEIVPTIDHESISNRYPRVFAILLCMRKVSFIRDFIRHESLSDQKLPFDSRPTSFPSDAPQEPELFAAFQSHQWTFCALEMNYRFEVDVPKQQIIPFVRQHPQIGGGGSAIAYKIHIHPDYNFLHLNNNRSIDVERDQKNTFVVKTYKTQPRDHAHHHNELNAFIRLRQSREAEAEPSLISFYGSFVHDGHFNIILEWADYGTLEEFLLNECPPTTGHDILNLWKGLLQLLEALHRLQGIWYEAAGKTQHWLGWHQDVNPSNILICRRPKHSIYSSVFKLADFGLSHFRKVSGDDVLDNDTRGTKTYGAPECYRSNISDDYSIVRVSPTVDVWSLGCIYSEVATWIVHGLKGVDDFESERRIAMAWDPEFRDSGCFHNSVEVLSEVKEHHEMRIRPHIRASDKITALVLDMIDDMLETQKERQKAHVFRRKARKNLETASRRSSLVSQNDADRSSISRDSRSSNAGVAQSPNLSDSELVSSPTTYEREENGESTAAGQSESCPSPYPMMKPSRSDSVMEKETAGRRNGSIVTEPRELQSLTKMVHEETDANTLRSQTMPLTPNRSSGGDYFAQATAANHNNGYETLLQDSRHSNKPFAKSAQQRPTARGSQEHRRPDLLPAYAESESSRGLTARLRHSQISQSSGVTTPDTQSYTRPGSERLSVSAALNWVEMSPNDRKAKPLSPSHLLNTLYQRDHIFIIDNSSSMRREWEQVKKIFKLLSHILLPTDPDGVEVYFTIGMQKHQKGRDPQKLLETVSRGICPEDEERKSDIYNRLNAVVDEYMERIKHPRRRWERWKKPLRRQNIYILTDGDWQIPSDAATPIRNVVNTLQECGKPLDQLGIQFIQFGKSTEGATRLRYLDSKLQTCFGLDRDIVDSERANGNVWKMLLGSINKNLDDNERREPDAGEMKFWWYFFSIKPPSLSHTTSASPPAT